LPFPLETQRLILRSFRDADLETFLAYRNDPEVSRYQGWQVPFERSMAEDFIMDQKAASPAKEGHWFQAALEHKSSHALIGDVGFFQKSGGHGQAYLGFTLARPYWGQGYASESTSAVIDYLFRELELHRIIAECDTDNRASIRLLERLGFRREAHHVESYWLGDRWGDEYVYAQLGGEWNGSAGRA
jgi:aminoglycoside 6'-N-acetyltransferase